MKIVLCLGSATRETECDVCSKVWNQRGDWDCIFHDVDGRYVWKPAEPDTCPDCRTTED